MNYLNKDKDIPYVTRITLVDTYDFSPDDWIKYITPLVNDALEEVNSGINLQHVFQKYIMIAILVGQGKTFSEAIGEVEDWEKTGTSKLLAMSKMSRYFNY